MEEEEDDSRGEESLQNDAAEKSLASTHVSPVSAVNHQENVESQNDADDEDWPRKISKGSSDFDSLTGVYEVALETAVFPGSLLTLNVSSNNINDLTEFMRLLPLEKLESISLANNPCVSNITFDYRIYVLSVLPSLQDIDCFVVSEEEQLKGEWLYSQGKGRAFKPDTGAHLSLVKYLEKYCPFDVEGKLVSSLDQSVVKAMEKRREMLSSSAYEDDSSHSLSLHSPYRAWTTQLEGKENQMPSSSADESGASRSISARISASSTPARQPSMTARSSARFEPPSRSSTMESVESSSTVTLVPAAKGHQE
ncbi:hypothetical protein ANCDUO_08220, partial [Ancylostoma duodenale]